jgi:hypothetical protein
MTEPMSPQDTSVIPRVTTPSSVYSSSPSAASSPSCSASEPTFDTDTAYRQQQALREWVSSQGFRSSHFLPTLHRESFIAGLVWLRARIDEFIQTDRDLYLEYRMLLTDIDENRVARASAYAGWYFHVPGPEQLEGLSRMELQQILETDLYLHDDVRRSNKRWQAQIEQLEERKRIRLHEERRRRRRMAVIDEGTEMEEGEGSGGFEVRTLDDPRAHFEVDDDFRHLLDHLTVQGHGESWTEYDVFH